MFCGIGMVITQLFPQEEQQMGMTTYVHEPKVNSIGLFLSYSTVFLI